jgi:hypothetical protein
VTRTLASLERSTHVGIHPFYDAMLLVCFPSCCSKTPAENPKRIEKVQKLKKITFVDVCLLEIAFPEVLKL